MLYYDLGIETRPEKTDCWLFCSKQTLRQPRNGVTDWSIAQLRSPVSAIQILRSIFSVSTFFSPLSFFPDFFLDFLLDFFLDFFPDLNLDFFPDYFLDFLLDFFADFFLDFFADFSPWLWSKSDDI